jgi:DNA-binding protein HU-beta
MNKQEMLRAVADKAGMTIKDTGIFYEAFVETLKETLAEGEKVSLVGFGTFSAKNKPARKAINPRTKETVDVPASVSPSLKFGKNFKEELIKK